MNLDAKTMKSVNKIVDDFVSKNRDKIANTRRLDKLESQVAALERQIKAMQKTLKDTEKTANLGTKIGAELISSVAHLRARLNKADL